MCNKYLDFKVREQRLIEFLPIKFIYDGRKKMMEEFGLTDSPEDFDKICPIGCGAYCLKKDKNYIDDMFGGREKRLQEKMKEDDFLLDAFKYELSEHEYHLTYDPTLALRSLGLSLRTVEADERLLRIFKQATEDYLSYYER